MAIVWSEVEKTFLRENYNSMSTVDIAEKLNRSYCAVANKMTELKLIRTIEQRMKTSQMTREKSHPIRQAIKMRRRQMNQRRALIVPLIVGTANKLIHNCDFILQKYYADQSTKSISSPL